MSWAGKILRVNLTTGVCKAEPLNTNWARAYIGSRGLAAKYLTTELDPKVDPLSPANKIYFTTGPLTGTMASTGGRYTVSTKSPLTGAIACSNAGGPISYTLTISNAGPSSASGATVLDNVPTTVTGLSASSLAYEYNYRGSTKPSCAMLRTFGARVFLKRKPRSRRVCKTHSRVFVVSARRARKACCLQRS